MSKKRNRGARRRKQQHARQSQPDTNANASTDTPDTEAETTVEARTESAATPGDLAAENAIEVSAAAMSAVEDEPATPPPDREQQAAELGRQFRQAREEQGIKLEDAAHQMHLPWRVVRKLESGDWRGIDSPIYLQGYLRSYADLLGLEPPELVDELTRQASGPTPLVSSGGISRGRYLAQRYAVAGTYLVITALIVVPVLILGINGGSDPRMAQVASLDPAASSSVQGTSASTAATADAGKSTVSSAAENEGGPLMASMAPVNLIESGDKSGSKPSAPVAVAAPKAPVDSPQPAHTGESLSISLSAPSWVEVTSANGKRVEYALLDSGEHNYSGQSPLTVRLGNAGAANVRMDGQPLDLSAYKRANVAYFRVDSQGDLHAPRNN